MINFIKDIDLINHVCEYDVVLIGTGIKNSKGNGFQHKISRCFKYVYNKMDETQYDDVRKLGTCLVIPEKYNFPIFVYCFITKGRLRPDIYPDALNYRH